MADEIIGYEAEYEARRKYNYDYENNYSRQPNIELIDLVVTFAEQNEQLHEQQHYFMNAGQDAICPAGVNSWQAAVDKFENDEDICGSTGCIAGWGSLISGWCQIRFRDTYTNVHGDEVTHEGAVDSVVNPSDGVILSMADAAEYEFGLTPSQASAMFDGNNKIEHIRDMVNALRNDPKANLGLMTTDHLMRTGQYIDPDELDDDFEF